MEKNKIKAIQINEFKTNPVINEIDKPKPGKNQVLVKVSFSPINPADILCINNQYPSGFKLPATIGFEGSGIIEEVGEDLLVSHKVGDRVSFVSKGSWAEYIITISELCIKIHEGNSMEIAASHFVNPGTVAFMVDIVKKAGTKAVIHDAGMSSLGKMLIRCLKEEGVKSINLVRRNEYFDTLTQLGSDYNLNINDNEFEDKLSNIVFEHGAIIYFSAVGGTLASKVFNLLPNNSTAYLYGVLSDTKIDGISIPELLFKNKKIHGLWLTTMFFELDVYGKIKLLTYIQERLNSVFKTEFTVFDYIEIDKALEHATKFSSHSKALLKFN
jgi:NADPH2:quinone reductase